jgi:hypothetical protein
MNYTSLVADVTTAGSIKRLVNRTDIDSTGILTEAQAWLYSRMRVSEMRARATISVLTSQTSSAKPTGFRSPLVFRIPTLGIKLVNTPVENFEMLLCPDENGLLPSGIPTRWCLIDDLIQYNTRSDRNFSATMTYYRALPALGPTNLTNFLTDRYPTLLRKVCLMFAYDEMKERTLMEGEEAAAYREIASANVENDDNLRGAELDFNWEESY